MEKMFALKTSFIILAVLVSLNAGKSVKSNADTNPIDAGKAASAAVTDSHSTVGKNAKFDDFHSNSSTPAIQPQPDDHNTTTTAPTTPTTHPTAPTTTPSTKPPITTPPPTPTTTKTPTPGPNPTPSPSPKPNPTPSPSPSPKPTVPPTAAPDSNRKFDGPSFIGGIVLTIGLTAIGFVAYKFYKARNDGGTYHTL